MPTPIRLARGWPVPAPHRLAQAQALSGQAKRAELYREEAEALRQRAGRLSRLQEELGRCRERLQAAEACKSQLAVRGGACVRGGAYGRGEERGRGGVGPGGERVSLSIGRGERAWPGEMGEGPCREAVFGMGPPEDGERRGQGLGWPGRRGLGPPQPLEGMGAASHLRFSLFSYQEERALSGALEASKALLEEQLEAARERCARLHEAQRENLLLRTRLGEAHAVRSPECNPKIP